MYYYLYHNIELLQKYYKGANQKSIVEEDLFKIKIPIPSLERQKEIVEYCEYNDTLIKQLEKEIENNKMIQSAKLKKRYLEIKFQLHNYDERQKSKGRSFFTSDNLIRLAASVIVSQLIFRIDFEPKIKKK